MLLDGKTVIITGAGSGIGAAAAGIFAREGAKLVPGARRAELPEQVTQEISANGGEAVFLAGSVEDMGPIPDMAESSWQKVMAVNLDSGFHAARHQIPALRRRGGGSIVITSSFVGHTVGLPGMGACAAAKAGLVGLTQVLAAEHGPENIRVNALLPGGTMTPMAGDDAGFHEVVRGFHALKNIAEPSEIANAALFLLSDHASFVSGSAMIADGGNSINRL